VNDTGLEAQDLADDDLSDLAGGSAGRGAGLADLLGGGGAPVPPPASPTNLTPAPVGPPPPAPPSAPPTASPSGRRRGVPGRPRTRVRPTATVYVSPSVKTRFENYRYKGKKTNLEVILEAISALAANDPNRTKLSELIAAAKIQHGVANDLFPGDPKAVTYVGSGSVQIQYSPTPAQEAVLDQLGAQLGIDTKSTWIAPVLNEFLPGKKDKHPTEDRSNDAKNVTA
jgi:hypothetical protein